MTKPDPIARVPLAFMAQMIRESVLKRQIAMALCVASASVLEAMTPFALRHVIDALGQTGSQDARMWFAFLLGLGLLAIVFYRMFQWIDIEAGPDLRAHVQKRQIGHLLGGSPMTVGMQQSGALVEAVKRSSMNVVDLTQILTFDVVNMLVVVVGIAFVIGFEDRFFLAMLCVWLVIYFVGIVILAFRCMQMGGALFQSSGASAGQIGDVLRNFETVFNYGAQIREQDHLGNGLNEERRRAMRLRRYVFIMRMFSNIAVYGLFAGMTSLAFLDVVNGTRSVGGFALVFTATNILIMTVFDLSRQMITIFENLGSIDGALGFILEEHAPGTLPAPGPAPASGPAAPALNGRVRHAVEFRDVAFHYPGQEGLLRNINLTLDEGHKLGLVGPSGAGKTTLIRLMLGQISPTQGTILIKGRDLRSYHPDEVRAQFAVVSQSNSIFNRSLRENIAYGHPTATDAEILSVARLASVEQIVADRDKGLDDVVGENGSHFSGGEVQRLNLARALIRPAQSILVLDEATSALDTAVEDKIRAALQESLQQRTVVAIAHRISTVRMMDQIAFLENGQIVEIGSHDRLVEQQGRYADIWQRQSHLSMRIGG